MNESTQPLQGLGETARAFGNTGRGGRPVHPATLTRWIQQGVRLPDGNRVKLRAVRIGSRWAVKPTWVSDFIEATTAGHVPAEVAAAPRSPATRRRASAQASAALDAIGA